MSYYRSDPNATSWFRNVHKGLAKQDFMIYSIYFCNIIFTNNNKNYFKNRNNIIGA